MAIDAFTILEALEDASILAHKRWRQSEETKANLWWEVYWALHGAFVGNLHKTWDGTTKPTRFLVQALRKNGVDDKVAELAATVFGEALEGCVKEFGLLVVRGTEIHEWYRRFEDVPGVRSCMTKAEKQAFQLYIEHPDLVSLCVLVDAGDKTPLARALMWENAYVSVKGQLMEAKLLDRVYSVSIAAMERLLALAKKAGAWTRMWQNGNPLSWICDDDEGGPIVSPDGSKESVTARVYLNWSVKDDPDSLSFPYMDTLKYLVYDKKKGRFLLSSRMPRKRPYGVLNDSSGYLTGADGFLTFWKEERQKLLSNDRNKARFKKQKGEPSLPNEEAA